MLAQGRGGAVERTNIVDVLVSETLDCRRQCLSRNTFNRIFTRRINVSDENHVGVVEGTCKLLHQIVSTRVTMRLKQDHDSPATGAELRRRERGPDLCRVM